VAVTELGASTKLFCAQPGYLALGWLTVFGQANQHRGQLSLLPSAERGISTGESAAMLCGWGGKTAGMAHSHSICGDGASTSIFRLKDGMGNKKQIIHEWRSSFSSFSLSSRTAVFTDFQLYLPATL